MKLKIYRDLSVFAQPEIDLSTEFNEVLMGVDEVLSTFISPIPLQLQIDDYIIFRNENYFIDAIPEYTLTDNKTFQYTVKFLHPKFRLNADYVSHLGDTTFTYFGDARAHLTLLLASIHTIDPAYALGEIDDTDQIFISYDGVFCLQALSMIAEACRLEYKVRGKVIDLKKQIGADTNLTFEYGRGKGLYSLSRKAINDENVINKVYGYGSSKNIDHTYRNGAKRLMFEGGFLTAATPYGVRAGRYINEDIKPERTAPCTKVEPLQGNGFGIYDSTLDFDINAYLQEGLVAKVVFQSGELAGNTFEITAYNPTTKKISLAIFQDTEGYILPNASFTVKVGDKFTLVDLNMPAPYKVVAENKLRSLTQAFLDENKIPKVAYDLPIDPKYIRTLGASLRAGDLVSIVDSKHGVNHKLRTIGIRFPLVDEYQVKATIANFVPYTFEDRVIASAINNQKEIKEITRTREKEAKRSAINLRVLENNIFDTDGLFDSDKINVGVLSAALGIFGVKSQNLSLSGVIFKPNYGANANSFQITNGKLIHHEIEIAGGGNTWILDGTTATGLVGTSLYYVYAKCSRSTLTGSFVVTTAQIGVEDVAGQYHFLVGVLYPVLEGYRDYDNTYGISTITGRTITSGIIKSSQGGLEINLDTGEIKGIITVLGGNAETLTGAQNKANAAYNNAVSASQAQYNTLTGQLKSMAYQDVVERAKLGNTVIQGGMLVNDLIDVGYLKANVINAGYIDTLELNSVRGKVGGWTLSNSMLSAGTSSQMTISAGAFPAIHVSYNGTTTRVDYQGVSSQYGSINHLVVGTQKKNEPNDKSALFISADFIYSRVGWTSTDDGDYRGRVGAYGADGNVFYRRTDNGVILSVNALRAQSANGVGAYIDSPEYRMNGIPIDFSGGGGDLSNYYTKAQSDGNYVAKTGGTMTGLLTMQGVATYVLFKNIAGDTIGYVGKGSPTVDTIYLSAYANEIVVAGSRINLQGIVLANNIISSNQGFLSQNYGRGLVGLYSATRYQEVFSMGESYRPPSDGTAMGNHYGIMWTHSNMGGQSIAGLAHQALFTTAGVTQTAIGTGIWTRGSISASGSLNAGGGVYDNGSRVLSAQGVANGYYLANNWIQFTSGGVGLYFPSSSAGTHLSPSDGTTVYGAWTIRGAGRTYGGFYDYNSKTNFGMYDAAGNGGDYNGLWVYYYTKANHQVLITNLQVSGRTTISIGKPAGAVAGTIWIA